MVGEGEAFGESHSRYYERVWQGYLLQLLPVLGQQQSVFIPMWHSDLFHWSWKLAKLMVTFLF